MIRINDMLNGDPSDFQEEFGLSEVQIDHMVRYVENMNETLNEFEVDFDYGIFLAKEEELKGKELEYMDVHCNGSLMEAVEIISDFGDGNVFFVKL